MTTLFSAFEVPLETVQSSSGASYAIPADRYAIVKVQVDSGGTFTIDGTTVLGSSSWNALARGTGNLWTRNTTGNVIAGMTAAQARGESTVNLPGSDAAGNYILGGLTSPTPVTNTTQTNNSGTQQVDPVYANATARTAVAAEFKVPEGTLIAGTGNCRYSVELYRVPGAET